MNQEFSLYPHNKEDSLSDVKISGATIHNSSIPVPSTPAQRFTFSNLEIEKCKHYACFVYGAVIKNVCVKGLTGGKGVPTFLWACLFDNVKVSGKISGIQFKWQMDVDRPKLDNVFQKDAKVFYEGVDVAIDISEAEFSSFLALPGIPASKIVRDTDTQFVLAKNAAERMAGNIIEFGVWAVTSEELLESGMEDMIVILPSKGRNAVKYKGEALELMDKGLLS